MGFECPNCHGNLQAHDGRCSFCLVCQRAGRAEAALAKAMERIRAPQIAQRMRDSDWSDLISLLEATHVALHAEPPDRWRANDLLNEALNRVHRLREADPRQTLAELEKESQSEA